MTNKPLMTVVLKREENSYSGEPGHRLANILPGLAPMDDVQEGEIKEGWENTKSFFQSGVCPSIITIKVFTQFL